MSCVLFGLGRDRTRVVSNENNHAALYTNVLQTHKRVGGHIQTDLFHGYHAPGAGIGCPCGNLHGRFFIHRPFYIGFFASALCNCLENFC